MKRALRILFFSAMLLHSALVLADGEVPYETSLDRRSNYDERQSLRGYFHQGEKVSGEFVVDCNGGFNLLGTFTRGENRGVGSDQFNVINSGTELENSPWENSIGMTFPMTVEILGTGRRLEPLLGKEDRRLYPVRILNIGLPVTPLNPTPSLLGDPQASPHGFVIHGKYDYDPANHVHKLRTSDGVYNLSGVPLIQAALDPLLLTPQVSRVPLLGDSMAVSVKEVPNGDVWPQPGLSYLMRPGELRASKEQELTQDIKLNFSRLEVALARGDFAAARAELLKLRQFHLPGNEAIRLGELERDLPHPERLAFSVSNATEASFVAHFGFSIRNMTNREFVLFMEKFRRNEVPYLAQKSVSSQPIFQLFFEAGIPVKEILKLASDVAKNRSEALLDKSIASPESWLRRVQAIDELRQALSTMASDVEGIQSSLSILDKMKSHGQHLSPEVHNEVAQTTLQAIGKTVKGNPSLALGLLGQLKAMKARWVNDGNQMPDSVWEIEMTIATIEGRKPNPDFKPDLDF